METLDWWVKIVVVLGPVGAVIGGLLGVLIRGFYDRLRDLERKVVLKEEHNKDISNLNEKIVEMGVRHEAEVDRFIDMVGQLRNEVNGLGERLFTAIAGIQNGNNYRSQK